MNAYLWKRTRCFLELFILRMILAKFQTPFDFKPPPEIVSLIINIMHLAKNLRLCMRIGKYLYETTWTDVVFATTELKIRIPVFCYRATFAVLGDDFGIKLFVWGFLQYYFFLLFFPLLLTISLSYFFSFLLFLIPPSCSWKCTNQL